jgi:hypothetical protein
MAPQTTTPLEAPTPGEVAEADPATEDAETEETDREVGEAMAKETPHPRHFLATPMA